MTDYQENSRADAETKPSEAEGQGEVAREENEVIELSDIAIGTTQEDEAIIELTEELIDEAMNGISGVTVEESDDHHMLDLSHDEKSAPPIAERSSTDSDSSGDESLPPDDDMEEELSRELDDYFGPEDEDAPGLKKAPQAVFSDDGQPARPETPAPVSPDMDQAVERAIRHMYTDQINHMIEEMVEKAVTAEVGRLKEIIISALKK